MRIDHRLEYLSFVYVSKARDCREIIYFFTFVFSNRLIRWRRSIYSWPSKVLFSIVPTFDTLKYQIRDCPQEQLVKFSVFIFSFTAI